MTEKWRYENLGKEFVNKKTGKKTLINSSRETITMMQ